MALRRKRCTMWHAPSLTREDPKRLHALANTCASNQANNAAKGPGSHLMQPHDDERSFWWCQDTQWADFSLGHLGLHCCWGKRTCSPKFHGCLAIGDGQAYPNELMLLPDHLKTVVSERCCRGSRKGSHRGFSPYYRVYAWQFVLLCAFCFLLLLRLLFGSWTVEPHLCHFGPSKMSRTIWNL